MKKYFMYAIFFAILLAISFSRRYWYNNPKKTKFNEKNSNLIRQPKIYLYAGIGTTIALCALGLFCLLCPEQMIANYEKGVRLPTSLFFLALGLPSSLFIFLQVNWKIEIGEDKFTFTNTFRKKRTYQFEDVEVKGLSRCTRVYYNNKRIVSISYLQENWDALEMAFYTYEEKIAKNNEQTSLKK